MPKRRNIHNVNTPVHLTTMDNYLVFKNIFTASPPETLDMCDIILTSEQGLSKKGKKKSLIIDGAFGKTHPGHRENNL